MSPTCKGGPFRSIADLVTVNGFGTPTAVYLLYVFKNHSEVLEDVSSLARFPKFLGAHLEVTALMRHNMREVKKLLDAGRQRSDGCTEWGEYRMNQMKRLLV